jgi:hypothetical protein
MSLPLLIITTVIAFAIHPVLGVIWLVAQLLGAFENNDSNDDK